MNGFTNTVLAFTWMYEIQSSFTPVWKYVFVSILNFSTFAREFHTRVLPVQTCTERGHGSGMVVTRISLHRLIAFHGNLFRPRMHFYTVHSSFEISFFRSIPRNSIIFTLPPSMFTSSILPLLFPLLKVSLKSDNETVFVHGVRE